MSRRWALLATVAALSMGGSALGQEGMGQVGTGQEGMGQVGAVGGGAFGPIKTDRYQATFIKLGANRLDSLLYEPATPGANAHIALVFTFPRATFNAVPAMELASRGYRVLWVTPYSSGDTATDGLLETSAGVRYMRSLAGVRKVVVMSHSGGGRMMTFYTNVALNGAAACQRPEIIYPCRSEQVSGLEKPDGLILLDPSPGSINTASSMDPAYEGATRSRRELDMYAAANGYDANSGSAKYPAEFIKRFYSAQSARNMQIIGEAKARLALLEQGKGAYTNDEPLVIPGAVNGGNATSLYHTDLSLLSRTKRPQTLLKADGTEPKVIVPSLRSATGVRNQRSVNSLCCAALNTTVRQFLAGDAIRTTAEFALTENDIVGVDWKSSLKSTPGSAAGVTVPSLVLAMSCYHFVVPDEIIYEHLAAKDKTFAIVEGANHGFNPCKREYGDTRKRSFDFVDRWLGAPARFP